MITKERLEELIKQGATIWTIYHNEVRKLNPDKDYISIQNEYTEKMFETKEDAEFELEFGNIARTETLKLPSWKKIKRKPTIIKFMSKDWKLCKLGLGEIVAVIGNGTKSAKKKYVCVRIDKNDYYFERTEKGYIEACQLCKKLFLGEEV